MSSRSVTIALTQSTCIENPEENLRKIEQLIRSAAERGAQIICLQELADTLYFPQIETSENFKFARDLQDPIFGEFATLARELGVVLIVPFFEKRAEGVYHNTALVLDADGERLGVYRKLHIPDDPGFYEKYYFTPGDLGVKVFATKFGKISVLICWDQWFPEAARLATLAGAEIIFYPTAIGWDALDGEESRSGRANYEAWETVMRGHAIANGVFVAAANRVGVEKDLKFWGGSFVANPTGEIITRLDHAEENLLVQKIDLAEIKTRREAWPHLRDRRVDVYGSLIKIYDDEN